MKEQAKNINFGIDRIISYSVIFIYLFLIIFGIISLFNPYWLISVSETNRKMEVTDIINNGILLSRQNKEKEAILKYDQALTIMPEYSIAIVNKAISYKRMKDFDKAISLFNKALTLDDVDSSNIYSNMKDTYFMLNDSLKAYIYFQLSLNTTHNDLDKHMKTGNYFFAVKQFDSAHAYYSSALNVRKKPKTYYNYEINININKYNIEKDVINYDVRLFDINCFEMNLKQDKGLAENYNKLGLMHVVRGELDSALSNFYKAINIWSEYSDALVNIDYILKQKRKMNQK